MIRDLCAASVMEQPGCIVLEGARSVFGDNLASVSGRQERADIFDQKRRENELCEQIPIGFDDDDDEESVDRGYRSTASHYQTNTDRRGKLCERNGFGYDEDEENENGYEEEMTANEMAMNELRRQLQSKCNELEHVNQVSSVVLKSETSKTNHFVSSFQLLTKQKQCSQQLQVQLAVQRQRIGALEREKTLMVQQSKKRPQQSPMWYRDGSMIVSTPKYVCQTTTTTKGDWRDERIRADAIREFAKLSALEITRVEDKYLEELEDMRDRHIEERASMKEVLLTQRNMYEKLLVVKEQEAAAMQQRLAMVERTNEEEHNSLLDGPRQWHEQLRQRLSDLREKWQSAKNYKKHTAGEDQLMEREVGWMRMQYQGIVGKLRLGGPSEVSGDHLFAHVPQA